MSNRDRLALVLDGEHAHDNLGDDNAGPLEIQPADSELMKWLKVSNRFALLERRMANAERVVNRITTRFATEGRPLPDDQEVA